MMDGRQAPKEAPMATVLALIIAFIGMLPDEARIPVCQDNPHIVTMAQAEGYIVYEDCSFSKLDVKGE